MRIQRNLSRAELAERSNTTIPSIWAWETGRTVPRKHSLCALAKGLDVPVEALVPSAPESRLAASDSNSASFDTAGLAELVESCKVTIADYAGIDPANVRITIEF